MPGMPSISYWSGCDGLGRSVNALSIRSYNAAAKESTLHN